MLYEMPDNLVERLIEKEKLMLPWVMEEYLNEKQKADYSRF